MFCFSCCWEAWHPPLPTPNTTIRLGKLGFRIGRVGDVLRLNEWQKHVIIMERQPQSTEPLQQEWLGVGWRRWLMTAEHAGPRRLRHAAGGRALGAANAGVGATVLRGGRVGGDGLSLCHRARTSWKICCRWTHVQPHGISCSDLDEPEGSD